MAYKMKIKDPDTGSPSTIGGRFVQYWQEWFKNLYLDIAYTLVTILGIEEDIEQIQEELAISVSAHGSYYYNETEVLETEERPGITLIEQSTNTSIFYIDETTGVLTLVIDASYYNVVTLNFYKARQQTRTITVNIYNSSDVLYCTQTFDLTGRGNLTHNCTIQNVNRPADSYYFTISVDEENGTLTLLGTSTALIQGFNNEVDLSDYTKFEDLEDGSLDVEFNSIDLANNESNSTSVLYFYLGSITKTDYESYLFIEAHSKRYSSTQRGRAVHIESICGADLDTYVADTVYSFTSYPNIFVYIYDDGTNYNMYLLSHTNTTLDIKVGVNNGSNYLERGYLSVSTTAPTDTLVYTSFADHSNTSIQVAGNFRADQVVSAQYVRTTTLGELEGVTNHYSSDDGMFIAWGGTDAAIEDSLEAVWGDDWASERVQEVLICETNSSCTDTPLGASGSGTVRATYYSDSSYWRIEYIDEHVYANRILGHSGTSHHSWGNFVHSSDTNDLDDISRFVYQAYDSYATTDKWLKLMTFTLTSATYVRGNVTVDMRHANGSYGSDTKGKPYLFTVYAGRQSSATAMYTYGMYVHRGNPAHFYLDATDGDTLTLYYLGQTSYHTFNHRYTQDRDSQFTVSIPSALTTMSSTYTPNGKKECNTQAVDSTFDLDDMLYGIIYTWSYSSVPSNCPSSTSGIAYVDALDDIYPFHTCRDYSGGRYQRFKETSVSFSSWSSY